MWRDIEKAIVITRRTRLQQLEERYATREQARFILQRASEHRAQSRNARAADAFAEIEAEHRAYEDARDRLLDALDTGLKVQVVDRAIVPTMLFGPHDTIVTLGQDGLVANVAKYAGAQPIIAINPDPERIDGILLPFRVEDAADAVQKVRRRTAVVREVTLAEATLDDGQRMKAFNELFVGARTHVSARYRLRDGDRSEPQSSSGILVCTGAGSTGWLSSVFNMVKGIAGEGAHAAPEPWDTPRLTYVVREPFASRTTRASMVFGRVEPGARIEVESMMAAEGVIFSDGVESDFCAFPSGRVATIAAAPERAQLVVPG